MGYGGPILPPMYDPSAVLSSDYSNYNSITIPNSFFSNMILLSSLFCNLPIFQSMINIFELLTFITFDYVNREADVDDEEKSSINDGGKMKKNTQNINHLFSQMNNIIIFPIVILSVILLQMLLFAVLVFNMEECSPLVLFSWWRNKIS